MQNRSNRGSGKPVWVRAHQARANDWDPIQRIALGPAVMETASTGRTHDCTRPVCTNLKITLAKTEPSTHDPSCVKTPATTNHVEMHSHIRRYAHRLSRFLSERRTMGNILLPAFTARTFLHSQDPYRTWGTCHTGTAPSGTARCSEPRDNDLSCWAVAGGPLGRLQQSQIANSSAGWYVPHR